MPSQSEAWNGVGVAMEVDSHNATAPAEVASFDRVLAGLSAPGEWGP